MFLGEWQALVVLRTLARNSLSVEAQLLRTCKGRRAHLAWLHPLDAPAVTAVLMVVTGALASRVFCLRSQLSADNFGKVPVTGCARHQAVKVPVTRACRTRGCALLNLFLSSFVCVGLGMRI